MVAWSGLIVLIYAECFALYCISFLLRYKGLLVSAQMLLFRRILGALLVFFFVGGIFQSPSFFQEAVSKEDPILFGGAILATLVFVALALLSVRLGNQCSASKGLDIKNYILLQQVWVRFVAGAGAVFGIYSALV